MASERTQTQVTIEENINRGKRKNFKRHVDESRTISMSEWRTSSSSETRLNYKVILLIKLDDIFYLW